MNILAHTCFIGTTGYANHARSFFTALNKFHTVKVRNYTVGKSWTGMSNTPHDGETYLTDEMKDMLILQTLHNTDGSRSNFPMYNYSGDFKHDVNIVLMEMNHYYFFDDYVGYKIAYNVWESTRYPDFFFNLLLKFDEVWVPTEWQYESLIEQGYPEERVFIVPEGVDVETFKPAEVIKPKDKFRFLLFGRWDFRKSTTEIIRTFGETFKGRDDVELICSVENPQPSDGLKTTQERINFHGVNYPNVVYHNFPSREEYVNYLQQGDVFVSCSRSEGWNLPLIEAMACGTPSIYSNWGGQLEFAYGKGLPVNISHMRNAIIGGVDVPGEICEPDFNDLSNIMVRAIDQHQINKRNAIADSDIIHEDFKWKDIAQGAAILLNCINPSKMLVKLKPDTPKNININFVDGPFVEILEDYEKIYHVQFIDNYTGKIEYELDLKSNHWARCSKKYYVNWLIKIVGVDNDYNVEYNFNPENKKFLIGFESKSLGDTIAWIPYVDKFQKDNNCEVVCCTFHNNLFRKQYTNIRFVEPGKVVHDLYGLYRIGLFRNDNNIIDLMKNPSDPKSYPLLKIASDILGLDYVEICPNLPLLAKAKKKMVSIAIHSTAQCKYWNNPTGWQDVVTYLKSKGYEVKLLSNEVDGYMGNKTPKGVTRLRDSKMGEVIKTLEESELFIGLSSGLSWLSWGVKTPTIIISGFTDDNLEPKNGVHRIINKEVCNGCWSKFDFDPGDWNWCPEHKGTDRQFECSKEISSEDVIKVIDSILFSV